MTTTRTGRVAEGVSYVNPAIMSFAYSTTNKGL